MRIDFCNAAGTMLAALVVPADLDAFASFQERDTPEIIKTQCQFRVETSGTATHMRLWRDDEGTELARKIPCLPDSERGQQILGVARVPTTHFVKDAVLSFDITHRRFHTVGMS